MLEVRHDQRVQAGEGGVSDNELAIQGFLKYHPDFSVFVGPLYRVVNGQVVKGLLTTAYAWKSTEATYEGYEGAGPTAEEALEAISKQINSKPKSGAWSP